MLHGFLYPLLLLRRLLREPGAAGKSCRGFSAHLVNTRLVSGLQANHCQEPHRNLNLRLLDVLAESQAPRGPSPLRLRCGPFWLGLLRDPLLRPKSSPCFPKGRPSLARGLTRRVRWKWSQLHGPNLKGCFSLLFWTASTPGRALLDRVDISVVVTQLFTKDALPRNKRLMHVQVQSSGFNFENLFIDLRLSCLQLSSTANGCTSRC